MQIVGCDFHPRWQQVAVFDAETGEITEHRLFNGDGEAERFYRGLGSPALIGIEACGNSQWFIELLERLGHLVWVGDAAQIRASYVRRQKTDRRDAGHILRLLLENRFPRLWTPTAAQRDLRQLLIHRHKLVEIRTRVKNGLQHLALNRGVQKQSGLWSVRGRACLEALPLAGWTARRREDLLQLLAELDRHVGELDEAASRAADEHPQARLLMTPIFLSFEYNRADFPADYYGFMREDRLRYAPLAAEAAWLGAGHSFPAGQSLVLIGEKML